MKQQTCKLTSETEINKNQNELFTETLVTIKIKIFMERTFFSLGPKLSRILFFKYLNIFISSLPRVSNFVFAKFSLS